MDFNVLDDDGQYDEPRKRGRPRGSGTGGRGRHRGRGRGRPRGGRGRGQINGPRFDQDLRPLGADGLGGGDEDEMNGYLQYDRDRTLNYESDGDQEIEEELEEGPNPMEEDDDEEERLPTCPAPRVQPEGSRRGRKRKVEVNYSQQEINSMLEILKERTGFELAPREEWDIIKITKECIERISSDMSYHMTIYDYCQSSNQIVQKQNRPDVTMTNYIASRVTFAQLYLGKYIFAIMEALEQSTQIPHPRDILEAVIVRYLPYFPQLNEIRLKRMIHDQSPFIDEMLKVMLMRGFSGLTQVVAQGGKALARAQEFEDSLDYLIRKNKELVNEFLELREQCYNKEHKLDESSTWGTRPLRKSLEPPYYKYEDESAARGITFVNFNQKPEFFRRHPQKWTNKDITYLRASIKESIVGRLIMFVEIKAVHAHMDCEEDLKRYLRAASRGLDENGVEVVEPAPLPIDKGLLDDLENPGPAAGKRNGRPKGKKAQQESAYRGISNKFLFEIPMGEGSTIRVSYVATPMTIDSWRTEAIKKIKKMSYAELTAEFSHSINWDEVANRVKASTHKNRSPLDCELAWKHEASKSINTGRWKVSETRKLKAIIDNMTEGGVDLTGEHWPSIAEALGTNRTEYQCFYRYKNKILPKESFKMNWTPELDEIVKDLVIRTEANWTKVALLCGDPKATKKQIQERWKKNLNPILKQGAFTRVEDALLLLTIEKLKPLLDREGHFACVMSYLPWRFETTWRDRATNLFSDWIVPWTMDEDKKLIKLAVEMPGKWNQICTKFNSFKNRKGCLTRYKILNKQIGTTKRFKTLAEYHEMYTMTRYNVFQYEHLSDVVDLLKRIVEVPPLSLPGFQLARDREPSENKLKILILMYNRDIMRETIRSLEKYEAQRKEYWKDWYEQYGIKKRTFDRRTFHPENAQSVASAIHIREIQLIPKDEVTVELTKFQEDVYMYYARFTRTKALKKEAKRPYLPDADKLKYFPKIRDIVLIDSEDEDVEEEEDAEKFWEQWDKETTGRKKRGRPRKHL